ncbi:hypothetical protein [Aurantimicrobium minutum]|nr:hypothetical protein [Aurantimicrobium minutum]MDH6422494.1 hypothetical protein [Aurantimicrobium minutum]
MVSETTQPTNEKSACSQNASLAGIRVAAPEEIKQHLKNNAL